MPKAIHERRWNDLRSAVYASNHELAERIDDILTLSDEGDTPLRDEPIFHITYGYGAIIVKDGTLTLPDSAPFELRRRCLGAVYPSSFPLAFVLKNSVEVFLNSDLPGSSTAPQRVISAGEWFGVFEALDAFYGCSSGRPPWKVSAGARSVHVLRKWGHSGLQRTLTKQLNLTNPESEFGKNWRNLENDAWLLLRRIARIAAPEWSTQIVLFPKRWIHNQRLEKSPQFIALRNMLFGVGWNQSTFLRRSSSLDSEIQILQHDTNRRYDIPWDYVLPHMKRMIEICQGEAVAFTHALEKDTHGPFEECKQWLMSIRDISSDKSYPVILRPFHMNEEQRIGYYSWSSSSLRAPLPDVPKWENVRAAIEKLLDDEKAKETLHRLGVGTPVLYDQPPIKKHNDNKRDTMTKSSIREERLVLARDLLPRNVDEESLVQRHRFLLLCFKLVSSATDFPRRSALSARNGVI
jgi:hypothetical protein